MTLQEGSSSKSSAEQQKKSKARELYEYTKHRTRHFHGSNCITYNRKIYYTTFCRPGQYADIAHSSRKADGTVVKNDHAGEVFHPDAKELWPVKGNMHVHLPPKLFTKSHSIIDRDWTAPKIHKEVKPAQPVYPKSTGVKLRDPEVIAREYELKRTGKYVEPKPELPTSIQAPKPKFPVYDPVGDALKGILDGIASANRNAKIVAARELAQKTSSTSSSHGSSKVITKPKPANRVTLPKAPAFKTTAKSTRSHPEVDFPKLMKIVVARRNSNDLILHREPVHSTKKPAGFKHIMPDIAIPIPDPVPELDKIIQHKCSLNKRSHSELDLEEGETISPASSPIIKKRKGTPTQMPKLVSRKPKSSPAEVRKATPSKHEASPAQEPQPNSHTNNTQMSKPTPEPKPSSNPLTTDTSTTQISKPMSAQMPIPTSHKPDTNKTQPMSASKPSPTAHKLDTSKSMSNPIPSPSSIPKRTSLDRDVSPPKRSQSSDDSRGPTSAQQSKPLHKVHSASEQFLNSSAHFRNLALAYKQRGDKKHGTTEGAIDHFHSFCNFILEFYFLDKSNPHQPFKQNYDLWTTLFPYADFLLNLLKQEGRMELHGVCSRLLALTKLYMASRINDRQNLTALDTQRITTNTNDGFALYASSEKYVAYGMLSQYFPETFNSLCEGDPPIYPFFEGVSLQVVVNAAKSIIKEFVEKNHMVFQELKI